jgi:DNA-binding response OmpR family regulator
MKKILVIEDEVTIRETLSEILVISDYKVIEAKNGKEGFKKAIESSPDLVVCDIMMPQMDGIDTIKAFQNHSDLTFIPFIFLSARSNVSDIRKGMNLGAEDYLTKPFEPRELLSVIELHFKKIKKFHKLSDNRTKDGIKKVSKELAIEDSAAKKKWTDYLQSAANVQIVILPRRSEISHLFPNNFIYFQPKFSVSGDFYWIQNFGDIQLIAVVDCTGHGILGSLLSICCYNVLNLAVQHYGLRKPKEILEKANELVLIFMEEHERTHNEVGMDVVICAIDQKSKSITYAGAKSPLYLITNKVDTVIGERIKKYTQKSGKPLFKIRGSRFTIGSKNEKIELEEHTIEYTSGDMLYLSSDGYTDQFGGPSDKCFKSLNFINLLLSIQNENLREQKSILAYNFNLWKGETEQTDDVTILGIKL